MMTLEVLSSRRIEELRQETQADHLCRHLSEIVAVGWPNSSKKLPHDLRQFYAISDELTVDNGLLLRGQRFVIPHSLQHNYIRQLHQGHPGLEATKRRARETMFWPSIYQDIEHEISTCASCNALRPHQTKEPLQLHDIPDLPWALPMTKAMYVPKVETQVQAALTCSRQRGRTHYDRSARPLASLQAGQTVGIQTDWQR